jgi:6-phosphogluconate dehydrogenase
MTSKVACTTGVIGLGTMGSNLALNIESRGIPVAVWNLDETITQAFLEANGGRSLHGATSLEGLVSSLQRPRRILMMITAGRPVDSVLEQLAPLVAEGDVVIDGGNSRWQDTRRREAFARERAFHFVGMGVSGGEEGALLGPSLMPGGSVEAYEILRPMLEAMAARSEAGPCVTHVGADGAGHFVKMVHNGIEYGDMQLLAEAYDVLSRGEGYDAARIGATFEAWRDGPLASFLVDLTAQIFRVEDPKTGGPLIDSVLDRAQQKGTGKWTLEAAIELAVAVPSIAAAVDARILSSDKDSRERLSGFLSGPDPHTQEILSSEHVHGALLAAKVLTYAQGFQLIASAASAYGWSVDLGEVARIWKAGCIIRSRLLDDLRAAYARDRDLVNPVSDPGLAAILHESLPALRQLCAWAPRTGIPIPALSASLAWYDSIRTARLPQNLTQAQRDAFGAHTYQRADDPHGPAVHTDWV